MYEKPQCPIAFTSSSIMMMIKNIESKIENRTTKGDKESLRRALLNYTDLYNMKKLDYSYLYFHYQNVTCNNCPDYLIPELFEEIVNETGIKFQPYKRDEKRDSDLMKLAGCKYYEDVYKDIENFTFFKCEQSHLARIPEYKKEAVTKTPLSKDILDNIQENWKSTDFKNQAELTKLFHPIFVYYPLTCAIITFELRGKAYIFTFQYMTFKSKNKKYIMRTKSTFDLETDEGKPFILLPEEDFNGDSLLNYTSDEFNFGPPFQEEFTWESVYEMTL